MDGDGIPLAFFFSQEMNEQTSLKPLEEKVLQDFDAMKFIYCSDAGPVQKQSKDPTMPANGLFYCHTVHKETK